MSTQMQLRGGTTAENLLFTGAQREITIDTDKNTVVVQDGITAGGFPLATEQALSDGTFYFNDDTAGGSAANVYILAPKVNTNTPTTYVDGIQLGFVTANTNTGPSTANFQALGVKSLKYADGSDPLAGDISGRVYLIYDAANDWLEIQRKATGAPPQIRRIEATVAGNALTFTAQPAVIDFRSTVLNSGVVNSRAFTSALTLTVPAGATLGTTNGVASRIVLLAIDNAGTIELAVVNASGGVSLDETGLINTTAISAGASSASTIYSTAARTGVPYRVIGFEDSTQATAGTWAASPSKVQGQGGQAIITSTPPPDSFTSTAQVITIGGPLTIAHGLGVRPTSVSMDLANTVADAGFSPGDYLYDCNSVNVNSSGTAALTADATNIYVRFGSSLQSVPNKGTGVATNITAARWNAFLRAKR